MKTTHLKIHAIVFFILSLLSVVVFIIGIDQIKTDTSGSQSIREVRCVDSQGHQIIGSRCIESVGIPNGIMASSFGLTFFFVFLFLAIIMYNTSEATK